jgi:hypothetical protein
MTRRTFQRAIVREKIDGGALPLGDPVKLWAGFGSGRLCAACEQPILPLETEYEPHYADERVPIYFHVDCHGAWEVERRLSVRCRSEGAL